MSIFKCKMCGGDLRVDQENGVAVCEYCGTRQTLPRFSGGRSGDLYARAGDYRRGNEFDKAAALYEQMLAEDGGDAELYWSLVLCRYGIEYVEDPADHRRVPIINRTQFKSILEDKDYRAALEHATPAQRRLYETEAQTIERLQRSILAISQREEPFDVFICYKELDEQGRRTMDSVLAMELYKELTRDGVKTFFSRVTLEDKLGVAYEPYIFAALHSARVMVVISTRQAYVNAVWVKNEWNRYLALIRSGEKKTLIPAYRDMSPYDLPEEFRYLQAQDLGRVGAMQDLVYGVEKLLKADPRHMPAPAAAVASSPVSGLLERAFLFLEDGEWASADEYCEKVLDAEPRNAEAYLGKLMVERKIRLRTQLSQQEEPFDGSDYYRKAMRFGSDELRAELTGCIDAIHTRRENERLAAIYRDLTAELERVDSEAAYRSLAQRFAEIGGYQDAVAQQELCLKKAENCRKQVIYNAALRLMTGRDPENYRRAMEQLEPIADWEDAAELIQRCRQNIDDIAAEEERKRLERERKEEERRIAHLEGLYTAALAAMEGAKNEAGYKSAAGKFDGICGYRDATQQRDRCLEKAEDCRREGIYQSARKQMSKGGMAAYRRAMATFQSITGYRDADEQAAQCQEQLCLLEETRVDSTEPKKKGKVLIGAIAAVLALALVGGVTHLSSGKNVDNDLEEVQPEPAVTKEEISTLEPAIHPGDTVTFGHYEQDYDTSNGPEPIQWKVLDVQGDKALIISEKVLACGLHRSTVCDGHDYTTWETSLIRSWMNDDFYDAAFTDTEKKAIQLTDVKDEANPYMDDIATRPNTYNWSAMEPGADTQDYVFALSVNEFEKYFSNPESAKAEATEVAKVGNPYAKDDRQRKALYTGGNRALELGFDWITMDGVTWSWWLRTVGPKNISPGNFLSIVLGDGSLLEEGTCADSCDIGIRPAMWVDAKVMSSTLNPGSIYTFGSYEQDYDFTNGPEPIQWKVLDVQDGKALLLSQDALIRLQYHPRETGATWKDCTLRQWLNDDFYHTAFSEEELERVCFTHNVNDDNPTYGTDGGEDTDDHVFLLSLSEAEKYFTSDEERQCEFSAAVNIIVDQDPGIQKDVIPTDDPYGYGRRWWLRTPGMYPLSTVIIEKDGSVSRNRDTGAYAMGAVCHQWNGVRPAIWIEID